MQAGRVAGKVYAVLASLGLAFLVTLPTWIVLIPSSHLELYHLVLPATKPIEAILIDVLFIFILISSCLYFLDVLPDRMLLTAWSVISVFGFWLLLSFLATNVLLDHTERLASLPAWYANSLGLWQRSKKEFLVAGVMVIIALDLYAPRYARTFSRLSRFGMAAFGLGSLWLGPFLFSLAHAGGPQDRTYYSNLPVSTHPTQQKRIIWILLDELSYDQTFAHPAAGISLPNLNQLRATSVSFGSLKPAGYYTDRIIPSLFLGRRILDIRSTRQGMLEYEEEKDGPWLPFNPKATLFAVAQRNGWSTGIAGLYNPYCRIFTAALDSCYWEALEKLQTQRSTDPQNEALRDEFTELPRSYIRRVRNPGLEGRETYLQGLKDLIPRAKVLIDDDRVRFVFLHFITPHPPGIYDRTTHKLRTGGTYLDNLVLADDLLGDLMKEINTTPSAAATIVIVSSDHSWRVPMWRSSVLWSQEEERASGGRFDDRPVLLIHFAGQQTGDEVTASEPELMEHDLIAQMLEGKIHNPADMDQFLKTTEATK